MVLTTLPISISPAKALPAITPIPQFPQNPKTLILHRCKTARDLNQVHAHLIKTRLLLNPSITENLLESAALILPNAMDYALSIFENLEDPDSLAYNIIIRSLTFKQCPLDAIVLFNKMLESSVQPDEFTFSSVLKACSRLRALGEGQQLHTQIVKCGFKSNGFVVNTLIHMYATCGQLGLARQVFDGLPERNVMAWNAMLAGYVKNERWGEVVELFQRMLELEIGFDEVTLISVLTACGRVVSLKLGEWMEANALKGSIVLVTSLVDMYANCGQVDRARGIFEGMERRDVVAWSTMISGYGLTE